MESKEAWKADERAPQVLGRAMCPSDGGDLVVQPTYR